MVEEKLSSLINNCLLVFAKLPIKDFVVLIGIAFIPILILSTIYLLIVSPLICKFYIIPKIERKVGRKLNYIPLVNIIPFATYFNQQIGISNYILNRYYAFKRKGERGVPLGGNLLTLKQIGYTIDMVSKAELIFSFLVKITLYISLISFLIVFIAAYLEGYR